jgi:HEAT repeat protein
MPVTLEDVVRALSPNEANLNQAAAALGVEALPHLRALVTGPDQMFAAKATYVAGLLQHGDGTEIVREAATRPDKMVRVAAISALQFLSTEEAETVLPGLLTDADPEIRQLAIEAAASHLTPEVNRALEVLSLTDPYPYLRDRSAEALGRSSESSP